MASLTRKEWINIANKLKGIYTYPNFLASDESINVWYEALNNYSVESINAAIKTWIQDHNQPPTPSDLIDSIRKINSGDIRRESGHKFWLLRTLDGKVAMDAVVDYAGFEWDASADEVRNYFLNANRSYDSNFTMSGKKIFPEERKTA